MLRQAAEDAGQEPLAHYRALGATMSDKQASLEDDKNRSVGGAASKVGGLLAAKVIRVKGTALLEGATETPAANVSAWAGPLRLASAGNAVLGTLAMGYELMDKGFVRAHAHGD